MRQMSPRLAESPLYWLWPFPPPLPWAKSSHSPKEKSFSGLLAADMLGNPPLCSLGKGRRMGLTPQSKQLKEEWK